MIFSSYWCSPLVQFSKFSNFLWVCSFLCKNLSNFVYPVWKLHNPYCHSDKWNLDNNDNFFCLLSKIGSACYGDSGGPMICEENDKVVFYGVASAVTDIGSCRENFVNIYASVHQHIELIENTLVRFFLLLVLEVSSFWKGFLVFSIPQKTNKRFLPHLTISSSFFGRIKDTISRLTDLHVHH